MHVGVCQCVRSQGPLEQDVYTGTGGHRSRSACGAGHRVAKSRCVHRGRGPSARQVAPEWQRVDDPGAAGVDGTEPGAAAPAARPATLSH